MSKYELHNDRPQNADDLEERNLDDPASTYFDLSGVSVKQGMIKDLSTLRDDFYADNPGALNDPYSHRLDELKSSRLTPEN